MGLDMYLTANKYFYTIDDEEEAKKIADIMGINKVVRSVTFRAMQWRKCYLVNDWFSDKLSDHDIAQECEIDREDIEELLAECTNALEGKPSYFDDNEVNDEFTFEMQTTKDGLEACLKDFPQSYWFTYSASW
jgi:predicted DNA-binding protein YlxM (UPF0122 family)